MAVDFPKTGEREPLRKMAVNLAGAIIPKKLRPRRWPEYFPTRDQTDSCRSFMEKEGNKETCTWITSVPELTNHQMNRRRYWEFSIAP